MKIAIISDSHDNVANLEKLILWLNENQIKVLLHAGDICAPSVLKNILGPKFKGCLHLIFGNVGDRISLEKIAKSFPNVKYYGDFAEMTIDNKKIAMVHLPEDYRKFLKENQASFLQSLEWGEFQAATGKKIWNLAVIEEKNNCLNFYAVGQIIRHELLFGKCYLYCPRGPVFELRITNYELRIILKLLVNYAKNLAKKENAIFFRIEPEFLTQDQEKIEILKQTGFEKSVHELQPKDTLILDLQKSEQEILAQMHYKTRYNIRLAEKRGVKIRQSVDEKDIEIFYSILQKTAARDKFSPHLKEYYQKQIKILGAQNLVKLFLAEYQNKIIAGILVSFYNQRATYLHGAHDDNFKSLMAPHLLQWSVILEAKQRECKIYDFWGIAPHDAPKNHPWQGITRFKRGFGGREVNYVGAWDFVFSKMWYWGYNFVHKLKAQSEK